MPNRNNAIDTRTVEEVDEALRILLFERGVNVLGLNGGDGTIHLGINRLIALAEQVKAQTGMHMPFPSLLFLNGGTLNIVSRATGTKGNPGRTVRQFTKYTLGKTLSELPSRQLNMLRVKAGNEAPRYGFIFGSEVVANALEMYTLFGEGYTGLGRFMTELVGGYALNTRLWQEHAWKLDAPTTSACVDSVSYPRYCCAVAGTIDLTIMKGAISAFKVGSQANGFFTKIVLETKPGAIIRMIPLLLMDQAHASIHDQPEAQRLQLYGGYTLDGELFLDRTPSASQREVVVTNAPFSLSAITL